MFQLDLTKRVNLKKYQDSTATAKNKKKLDVCSFCNGYLCSLEKNTFVKASHDINSKREQGEIAKSNHNFTAKQWVSLYQITCRAEKRGSDYLKRPFFLLSLQFVLAHIDWATWRKTCVRENLNRAQESEAGHSLVTADELGMGVNWVQGPIDHVHWKDKKGWKESERKGRGEDTLRSREVIHKGGLMFEWLISKLEGKWIVRIIYRIINYILL